MGLLIISSMMVLGGMYLIFAFVWWILQIIANWNIFTKAGEAGWKSLIPIYGDYDQYHVLRKTCKSIRTWYWICDRTHLITANLLTDSWLWL